MRIPSLDKIAFVLSLAVLSFVYGYATERFDLFPNRFLERVVRQAMVVGSSSEASMPEFVSSRVYDREGVRVVQPAEMRSGVTLISSVWKDSLWRQEVRLVDRRGDLVHRWKVDPARVLTEPKAARPDLARVSERSVHGTHLFPNGDLLLNVDYVGSVRMDACGEILWRVQAGNHHSVARAADGSFWIPGVTREPRGTSPAHPEGFPGLREAVYQDQLLRISGEGEVLEKINVLDVLYANDLERHIVKAGQSSRSDVTHLNDIEPLLPSMADEYPTFEAGDLLVSLRNLNLVLVLDPGTRRVEWHASEPFIRQHDPDFTGDGWIGVFDNNQDGTKRGSLLGGSRIVMMQPHTDSVRVPFPTTRSEPFYTDIQGKWQLLNGGNMLLTEAQAGRVVEVAPDGTTVWEWVMPPYRESRVPEVSEATRYTLTADEVASWPCSPDEEPEDRSGRKSVDD